MSGDTSHLDSLIDHVEKQKAYFNNFMESILKLIFEHPESPKLFVHSTRHRIKSNVRIREKIQNKIDKSVEINLENVFEKITDIAGLRILYIKQEDFEPIHKFIMQQVEQKEWHLFETPKAKSWDPETIKYYQSLGVSTEFNERYYTSVHYVLKRNTEQPWTCEVQVRNLFEEIWGEVDHSINYPVQSPSKSARDQIMVLAKLVASGSRLVDSIYSSHRGEK